MLSSDLVFTTHYGKAATVSYAGKELGPITENTYSKVNSSSFAAPAYKAFGPSVSDAMGRLLEIVANMSDEKQDAAIEAERAARNAERIERKLHIANLTKETFIEDVKSGADDRMFDVSDAGSRAWSMRMAIANDTAQVYDLEEFGLHSEGTYRIHYYGGGKGVGMSGTFDYDREKLMEIREEKAIKNEDGTHTDRETGKRADFLQIGHKHFYVTW